MAEQCKRNVDDRITCPSCGGSGGIVHGSSGDGDYEDCAECCRDCDGFGTVYPEDLPQSVNKFARSRLGSGEPFHVGDLVSRDGADIHRVTKIVASDAMAVECIKAPSSGWCKVGDADDCALARRYEKLNDAAGKPKA